MTTTEIDNRHPAATGPTEETPLPDHRYDGPQHRNEQATTDRAKSRGSRAAGIGGGALLGFVLTAPIVLNAENIVGWASDPTGLGLDKFFAIYAFGALDAAAFACILFSWYATWVRGERPGAIGIFVWAFAAASAFAGFRHGTAPGTTARDAFWFFPSMSFLGPALLEVLLARLRRWYKSDKGHSRPARPSFGATSWMPILGSFQETFGAWRLAGFLGMSEPGTAAYAYRALMHDAGWFKRWRVLSTLRKAQVAASGPGRLTTMLLAGLEANQERIAVASASESAVTRPADSGDSAANHPPIRGGDSPDAGRVTPTRIDDSGTESLRITPESPHPNHSASAEAIQVETPTRLTESPATAIPNRPTRTAPRHTPTHRFAVVEGGASLLTEAAIRTAIRFTVEASHPEVPAQRELVRVVKQVTGQGVGQRRVTAIAEAMRDELTQGSGEASRGDAVDDSGESPGTESAEERAS